jgi:large subunit ribosomal protein L24
MPVKRRPPADRKGRLHVRKGDQVYVISGADKGKGPVEVVQVIPERRQVIVQGINLRWKHMRPSQQSPKGGRVKKEFPIDASKVLLYSPKAEKGVRVRRVMKDGKRVRVGTCGTEF